MEIKRRNTKTYVITGKARHGKDSVAAFIQDYYHNSGKDILNLQYGTYIKEYAKKISDWDGSDDETKPRELLQKLGTEVIRKNIDELFFVKRIIGDIIVYSYFFDAITISDGRFKVEVDIPKKEVNNIIAIRVERPNFDNGLTEEQKNHISEIDLDDYEGYDYVIENDGTLEQLEIKVKAIIEEVECES